MGLVVLIMFYRDEAERFLGDQLDGVYRSLEGYDDVDEDVIDDLTTRYQYIIISAQTIVAGSMVRHERDSHLTK